jgi:hypothetical protein
MSMKKNLIPALLVLQFAATYASAQGAARVAVTLTAESPPAAQVLADAPSQSVVVSSVRDPDWKSYPVMLKGMDAFSAHHQLAPQASLHFALSARHRDVIMKGITLRIESNETTIPVPIAEDGTFILPRDPKAAQEKAELVLNRKKGELRWRPDIHTPQLPENVRRLGDLRLECEVLWAVEKDAMSFFDRNTTRLLGGMCASASVYVQFGVPRPVRAATLVSGERRAPILVGKNHNSFTPPLHDRSWPDDALIEFDYIVDAAPTSERTDVDTVPAPGSVAEAAARSSANNSAKSNKAALLPP